MCALYLTTDEQADTKLSIFTEVRHDSDQWYVGLIALRNEKKMV